MRQDSIISRGSLKLTNSNFPILFDRKLLNLKILRIKLKIYQDWPQKYDMTEKKNKTIVSQISHRANPKNLSPKTWSETFWRTLHLLLLILWKFETSRNPGLYSRHDWMVLDLFVGKYLVGSLASELCNSEIFFMVLFVHI